jgi:spore coat polysaccharide biosynthesis predicted glycosyltransferase SpsG
VSSLDGGVLVLADAGPDAGLGHMARCTGVATALGVRGVRCRCVAVGPETQSVPAPMPIWEYARRLEEIPARRPTLVLLDSYRLEPETVRAHTNAEQLAVIHDQGALPDCADLVVTSDPGLVDTLPQVVGGLRMSCLRPEFWGLPAPADVPERIRRVLVTTGGGDPGGHAVALGLTVNQALPDSEITLVRGPQASYPDPDAIRVLDRPDSLLEVLMDVDLVVTMAGSSLLEALAVGTPTVALVVAENQRAAARVLVERGATEVFAPESLDLIAGAVSKLAGDRARRRQCVRRGRELVDGYGALRVAFLLWRLIASD